MRDKDSWRSEIEDLLDLPIGALPQDLVDAVYSVGNDAHEEAYDSGYEAGVEHIEEEVRGEAYTEGYIDGKMEMWEEINSEIEGLEP